MHKECRHCGSFEGVLCVKRERKWVLFSKCTQHKCLGCGYLIEEDYLRLKEEREYHGGE